MPATYVVRVRDIYVGVRGKFAEECVTNDKREADMWFKQWKSEYDRDSGYTVTKKVFPDGLPKGFMFTL